MRKLYLSFFAIAIIFCTKGQSVVISQVYGGGGNASAPYQNDYVELFNAGSSSVAIGGWSIQYASATGTSWTVMTIPVFTIQAGQYFLYKLGSSGVIGATLPAPDATNALNISAANGKLALVNNATALSGSCPTGATIIDFVGFGGTANCFEGAGPTPTGSNTTALLRANNGCQDLNQNATDFATAAPNPRNSASPFNPCTPTCTTPTQKATNMRYGGSVGTSMTVYFTRGNGKGSLVLCRQGAAVNASPVNGNVYTANTIFGSGSNIGGGNFAVFNTTFQGVNAFTISNLVIGTKYYFAVFEYNDPNKCYTATGLVDSFIVGGTLLNPGDLVFVGWDNSIVSGGEDKIYLMNMVDIAKGTQFSITNSRFEAGAAANVRTNRWYGGSTDPYQDPEKHDFEYVGTSAIAKGSVIAMESNSASGFTNFTINGVAVPASDFSAKTGFSNFISNTGTDADQLYITQGRFTAFGTAGVDRYNLYNGIVIHGISVRTPWIPLSSAVSSANTGGSTRQSRIPPDILCINTEFASSALGFGVYNRGLGTSGSKNQMLSLLKNPANWNSGAGTTTADDVIAAQPNVNNTFTINSPVADGVWQGGSTDWFDCGNWEGLHVPDTTTATFIYGVPDKPNNTEISLASPNAVQYSNTAKTGSLTVMNNGSLTMTGAGNEKLIVEKGMTLQPGSTFFFESNNNSLGDSLILHDFISDNEPTNSPLGFQAGKGTVILDEARTNDFPYTVSKASPGTINIFNLGINNSRSTNFISATSALNNLNLAMGYVNVIAPNGLFRIGPSGTITSPVNVYGQSNKGYFNSFVNGKMYYSAGVFTISRTFPIGKIYGNDTLFAPLELTKTNSAACIYDAEYFPTAYSDLSVDIAQLHHVSSKEHWIVNSSSTIADAQVTLSWRPWSQVGDGTNNPVSFDSLMVAHYFDDDGGGTNPSLWHVDGGSNVIMPKNPGYNFNYGLITTIASTALFSPFTLGTRGIYNNLPLKLLDFSAILQQGIVKLQWLTEAELFVDRYQVEKSTDGFNFISQPFINAVNSLTRHTYTDYDISPASGWNYYRLKIFDKAGKQSYSDIIKVFLGKPIDFQVYPDPAADIININLPASSSISELTIVNSSGQVVKQLATADRKVTINIESLSKGVYFIKILNCRQTIAQKFTKQ